MTGLIHRVLGDLAGHFVGANSRLGQSPVGAIWNHPNANTPASTSNLATGQPMLDAQAPAPVSHPVLRSILNTMLNRIEGSSEPGGAQESAKGFSLPSGPRAQNGYNSRKWTNSMDDSDSSDAYAYDNAYTTEAPAGTGIGRM